MEEYYCIIKETDLQLIAAVVDKAQMQEKYGERAWYAPAAAYEFLLQRVVQEIREPGSVAVTIDDMTGATPVGNQYKQNLRRHHAQLRKKGSSPRKGLSFAPLAGDIRFVNSAHSHQVQVADVVAYNVYRQFVEHGDAWETLSEMLPTYLWFIKLGGKFRCDSNRRIQGYGIVKCPLMKQVQWKYDDSDENERAAP